MTKQEAQKRARQLRRKLGRDWEVEVCEPTPWQHPELGYSVGMFDNVTGEIRFEKDGHARLVLVR